MTSQFDNGFNTLHGRCYHHQPCGVLFYKEVAYMATKRIVSTSFWTDRKVDTFSPEDKYFMLYLLTNPRTTQLGIYEFSIKHAAFELGYSTETVVALLDRFQNRYKIIMYSDEYGEIAIKNYLKHSIVKGGKPVLDCLKKELGNVKCMEMIAFVANANKNNENATVCEFINYIKETYSSIFNDNDNDNDNERIVPRIVPRIVTNTSANDECVSAMELFSTICKNLPKPNRLTEKRKRAIKKAKKDIEEFGGWDKYFSCVASSQFLNGKSKNGWKADFDWILKPDNMVKIMEGNYQNNFLSKENEIPSEDDYDVNILFR